MTFRISIISILFGLLVLLIAACGGAPAPADPAQAEEATPQAVAQVATDTPPTAAPPPTAEPEEPTSDEQAAPDGVIATVNGEPITVEAYNIALERRRAEVNAADDAALETFVLTTLINQKITEQAAERMGITVTDAEVDAEIAQLQAIAEESGTEWDAWLDENGYTEAALRDELRTYLLVDKVRNEVVGDVAERTTRQVHARHILVDTEAEARDIRQQLLNGASFVELAAQHSNDVTTKDEGGDLGWFTEEELLEPVVAEVAFSQEPGDISEPVATRLGYHIVETLAFDDLPLQPEKRAQVERSVFDEWLQTQNDSAIIEYYR